MSSRQCFGRQSCEFCGNTFTKREHLERHVRTHTRERPFACHRCAAKFPRKDTLRRHMQSCHNVNGSTPTVSAPVASPPGAGVVALTPPSLQANIPDTPNSITAATSTASTGGFPSQNESGAFDFLTSDPANDPTLIDLDWQWDDALNLDASFRMENVGTSDLNTVNPGLPWLPLQVPADCNQDMNFNYSALNTVQLVAFSGTSGSRDMGIHDTTPPENEASSDEEISRALLSASLNRRVPETQLPSTAFLNRCIKLFTTRLWPLVPIIHLPTFRPAQTNPLLLLSICSLGALSDGSNTALYYAIKLFDSVRKTILVSCTNFATIREDKLQVLQAAVLGQTFAILSSQMPQFVIAKAFHGTLCVAADAFQKRLRHEGRILDASGTVTPQPECWDTWIRSQTIERIMGVLHVHDGELAVSLSHPGMLSKHPAQASRAAPNELFLAKTAEEWSSLSNYARRHSSPSVNLTYGLPWQRSPISSYATLAAFLAEIGRLKTSPLQGMNECVVTHIQSLLIDWAEELAPAMKTDAWQRLSVQLLWHSCFIFLFCDIESMEKISGQEMVVPAVDEFRILREWASTEQAERCAAHAIISMRLVEQLKASDPPALHVARAAFHAGLVLSLYSFPDEAVTHGGVHHANVNSLTSHYSELSSAKNLNLFSSSDLAAFATSSPRRTCRTYAFGICATLRHLGPWKNARMNADRLDRILEMTEAA